MTRLLCVIVSLLLCWPRCSSGAEAPASPPPELASARIDELVFGVLRERGIEAAEPCSDEVFVRRVFIDVIGTLPSAGEVGEFLSSKDPGKRRALITRLLRRPEFNDLWALKLGDLLRVKAEFPVNLWPNAAQAYHRWLWEAVASGMPVDRLARELLLSNGSNFRRGPVNFYRAVQRRDPRGLAQASALFLLGERAENWPAGRLEGFAQLFSQVGYKATGEWKEEIVFFDASKAPAGGLDALLPDGTRVRVPAGKDPRLVFADWIQGAGAPAFHRAMANRIWGWLLGRGVAEPVDDLRPDRVPSNPALFAFLGEEFGRRGCDLRAFFSVILNSRVYQLSSTPRSADPAAEALFAHHTMRRLDAEVLIDAISQLTGSTEQYVSAIPEPFTYSPQNLRAIALPDGSITSSFLELFGRPARDTGLESERNNTVTALQRLHLLNSPHIRRKLEQGPRIQKLAGQRLPAAELADLLCLSALSRHPSSEELPLFVAQLQEPGKNARDRIAGLLWALINTNEFLHRH